MKMWCDDDGTILKRKMINAELRQYCPQCQRVYGRVKSVRKVK